MELLKFEFRMLHDLITSQSIKTLVQTTFCVQWRHPLNLFEGESSPKWVGVRWPQIPQYTSDATFPSQICGNTVPMNGREWRICKSGLSSCVSGEKNFFRKFISIAHQPWVWFVDVFTSGHGRTTTFRLVDSWLDCGGGKLPVSTHPRALIWVNQSKKPVALIDTATTSLAATSLDLQLPDGPFTCPVSFRLHLLENAVISS